MSLKQFFLALIVGLIILGLTIKEKWTTDNVLGTQVSVEDQFVNGLKVTLDTSFAPQSG